MNTSATIYTMCPVSHSNWYTVKCHPQFTVQHNRYTTNAVRRSRGYGDHTRAAKYKLTTKDIALHTVYTKIACPNDETAKSNSNDISINITEATWCNFVLKGSGTRRSPTKS